MSSVSAIALSGMQAAVQRVSAAAGGIASRAPEADLISGVLDLVTAKHDFAANLAILRAEDDMLGRLLDIKA